VLCRTSGRSEFSTVIHTFAQVFSANSLDLAGERIYVARQIEPEAEGNWRLRSDLVIT
jgi:hypothetical protein